MFIETSAKAGHNVKQVITVYLVMLYQTTDLLMEIFLFISYLDV